MGSASSLTLGQTACSLGRSFDSEVGTLTPFLMYESMMSLTREIPPASLSSRISGRYESAPHRCAPLPAPPPPPDPAPAAEAWAVLLLGRWLAAAEDTARLADTAVAKSSKNVMRTRVAERPRLISVDAKES